MLQVCPGGRAGPRKTLKEILLYVVLGAVHPKPAGARSSGAARNPKITNTFVRGPGVEVFFLPSLLGAVPLPTLLGAVRGAWGWKLVTVQWFWGLGLEIDDSTLVLGPGAGNW